MIALCSLSSLAQSQEAKNYIIQARQKINNLYEEAQQYYNDSVQPIEEAIRLIPESSNTQAEEAKKRQLQNDSVHYFNIIQQNLTQIENLNNQKTLMTGEALDHKIFSFSAYLKNNNCNPKAIKDLEAAQSFLSTDKYKKGVKDNLKILNNYQRYCDELIRPLEDIAMAIENNGGRKIEEGSKYLDEFDNSWNNASYIKNQEELIKNGENIVPLDDFIVIVNSLRKNGFEGGLDDVNLVIAGLTPTNYEVDSPLDEINNLNNEIVRLTAETDSLKTVYENIKNELWTINTRIHSISTADDRYNELEQKRYDRTEVWYDIHEELDKELIAICQYCLSRPYDKDFEYLATFVTPLLDKVYHKSYTARINQYRDLLTNYSKYIDEIARFLDRKEIYTNNEKGQTIPEKHQKIIGDDFNSLTYVKNYYSQRNDPKGVYSPYLNNVLQQFEALWRRNFAHSKSDYEKLKESVDISNQVVTPPSNRHNNRGHHQPELNNGDNDETTGDPYMNPAPNQQPQTPGTEPEKPNVEPDKPKQAPDDPIQFQA